VEAKQRPAAGSQPGGFAVSANTGPTPTAGTGEAFFIALAGHHVRSVDRTAIELRTVASRTSVPSGM
jgi:hypothetical protein